MTNDWFDKYRSWLEINRDAEHEQEKDSARKTLLETFKNSVAYQAGALRNGVSQPIIATRSNTRKCRLTVMPEDTMSIGDLIYVFNEYWICMELYADEYELIHGELWLCNQLFGYQDLNGRVIKKHAIIDDGSYAKGSDKAIPVTNNTFNCYVSMDEDSKTLCVDKRLAIYRDVIEIVGEDIDDIFEEADRAIAAQRDYLSNKTDINGLFSKLGGAMGNMNFSKEELTELLNAFKKMPNLSEDQLIDGILKFKATAENTENN